MRKPLLLLATLLAFPPPTAFAQPVGGGGPADSTAAVKSNDMGMPGQSTNAVDQYLQRKGLQDLSTGQSAAINKLGPARPARKDELIVGASVNDKTGGAMAKIAEVEPDGVVVSMGTAKVKVPAEAFGHNKAGLLLDMTKAQFEQVVAQAK
jgi:hypothetical protein